MSLHMETLRLQAGRCTAMLQEALGCDRCEAAHFAHAQPERYGCIVFAGGIYAGKITKHKPTAKLAKRKFTAKSLRQGIRPAGGKFYSIPLWLASLALLPRSVII